MLNKIQNNPLIMFQQTSSMQSQHDISREKKIDIFEHAELLLEQTLCNEAILSHFRGKTMVKQQKCT